MRTLAANLGFLFTEVPYLERLGAARAAGFDAVESAWPSVAIDDVVAASRSAGVRFVLLNAPAGDLARGERGRANDPDAVAAWRTDVVRALEAADRLGCPTINVLAGNGLDGVPEQVQRDTLDANLDWALERAAAAGRRLVVELLNRHETPRYLVTDLAAADRLLDAHGAAGLRLQLDAYHVARNGLDPAAVARRYAGRIGHAQVADAPGRHEPGSGAIDWPAFLGALGIAGYDGPIGLEYEPAGRTLDGLADVRRLLGA